MGDINVEADETKPVGVIMEVRNCLSYTAWSAFVFNSLMAICTILSTPGLVAKVIVAIDLCIESLLCRVAKALFFEVVRLVIHEVMFHQKFLWLFDPVFAEAVEEDEDF